MVLGDLSGRKRIDPADIKIALNTILQSETFARSERSRELLKYIVERDLDGEADRLKGFAIALDVFDREENFDPSTDAVVRVQAGRLRDLIDTYYSGEGKIVTVDGQKVAAYRDEQGTMHAASAVCSHLGCIVNWNQAEKSWDCPCHGARYTYEGEVIRGPAIQDLEKINP